MKTTRCAGLLLLLFSTGILAQPKLKTMYEWNYIDYLWESNAQKAQYERNGDYEPSAQVPIDVDKAPDGRIFVTIIRSAAVPATLNTISNVVGPSGRLLKPYPNWSWHKKGDCDSITNVYRVAIDECNRLWVLDNGQIEDKQICPAQLLAFDLNNDQLLQRIKIPKVISAGSSEGGLLVTPVVDTSGRHCEQTTVFMADVNGFGLVIWNGKRTTRIESPVFKPVPLYNNYTVAGETFSFNDGILGMALTPKTGDNVPRRLIFRPMSSLTIFMAQSKVLEGTLDGRTVKFYGGNNVLPSQAAAQGVSSDGTLFFGLATEIALGCWNIYKPLEPNYVDMAVVDKERLQFISGLKVVPPSITRGSEEVWTLSNRLQRIMSGTQNLKEINFRIMMGKVSDLIDGTKCVSPPPSQRIYHAVDSFIVPNPASDEPNSNHNHNHHHHHHHNHNHYGGHSYNPTNSLNFRPGRRGYY